MFGRGKLNPDGTMDIRVVDPFAALDDEVVVIKGSDAKAILHALVQYRHMVRKQELQDWKDEAEDAYEGICNGLRYRGMERLEVQMRNDSGSVGDLVDSMLAELGLLKEGS